MARDSRLVIALLALLSCGASYIPLDVRYPGSRIQAIIEDSKADYLITSYSAENYSVKSIQAPADNQIISVNDLVRSEIAPADLAYIIYTSGSTGKPKGVMINHANASSMINWALATYSIEELRFTLASTSICFDLSIFEIFVPLAAGACVVLVENALSLIQKTFSKPLTLINTVPSAIQELLRLNVIPSSVTTINLAGEALQQILINQLYQKTQVKRVYNLYGPSETTTYSTCFLAEFDEKRAMLPIGTAITGTTILLLDEHQQIVPSLKEGEIYIAGAGVSQGYCNRQDETDKRFVELNHLGKITRFYRTGDLARLNTKQELEYLGRIDFQMKIRGIRIEPGEIIHQLLSCPEIEQAYVCNHPEIDKGQQLIAYIVYKNGSKHNIDALKAQLNNHLPEYMLPKYFMILDKLPLNNNGKIERAALPFPDLTNTDEIVNEYQNTTEEKLAQIWQTLLPNKSFDRTANFFHLGGHSLLATRLLAAIREQFSVKYQLEEIFDNPSIESQATLIQQRLKLDNLPIAIEPKNYTKKVTATDSQKRLWFLQQAEKNIPISNIPIVVKISGQLDIAALEQSLTSIIARHEILRTVYHTVDGEVLQVVQPEFKFTLPVINAEDYTEEKVAVLLATEANYLFDLTQDLMLRACLINHGKNEFTLLLTQHHIASDAWSLNILMHELSTFYHAYHVKAPLPQLPKLMQYAEYSQWLQNYLTKDLLQHNLDYWLSKLQGVPDQIKLPYDLPRPAKQSYRGKFLHMQFKSEQVEQLKQLALANQSSLFMILLTAFNILLYRYSKQEDFCVGILTANREHTNIQHTLGFFVNTLIARAIINPAGTAREMLKQVRQTVLDGLAHQQLPFDKLIDVLQPARHLNRHPVFQVLFSLQNAIDTELTLDNLTIKANEFDRNIAKFDLTLSMVEKNGELSAIFEYNTDLFYENTIARMSEQYVQILQSIIEDIDEPIATIKIATRADIDKYIIKLNDTQRPYHSETSIPALFSKVAAENPEQLALITDAASLTYAELEQQANQLANLLIEYGVEPQTPIAMLLPRGLAAIIAMLAILKTGSIYVPLDPNWPAERLNYILTDAKINIVVTQSSCLDNLPATSNLLTISLDQHKEIIAEQSTQVPAVAINPQDSCYIMYTSGSTGRPKGVLIKHQGVLRLVTATNYVELNKQHSLLQVSPLAFDGSTFDIWGSLLNAAKLILMPEGVPSLNKLAQMLETYKVTTLFITTQLFNSLVDFKLNSMKSLQQLYFGGEVASIDHIERFVHQYPHCRLHNIYGPTECTTFALSYLINNNFDKTRPIPLGTPISNTYAVILTEQQQLAQVGVTGELYLGGPGLAQSYLNQPALTLEKFVANPLAELPVDRLYKTGDLAYYSADGVINFAGRIDNQIKLRGHRIELHEVEQIIRELNAVLDAVVILQKPEDLLIAYVKVNATEAVTGKAIRQQLAGLMPKYMLPDAVVIINEYPLNANGKVDKERLPKFEFQRETISSNDESWNNNPIFSTIYQVWEEVLAVKNIGYEENFFEVGGNSLKLVHVLERLQTIFSDDPQVQAKLEIATLFQYPTISSLAKYLGSPAVDSETVNNKQHKIRQKDKRKLVTME